MNPTEPLRRLTLVCSAHGVAHIKLSSPEGIALLLSCGCHYHMQEGEMRYSGNGVEDEVALVTLEG